MRSMSADHAALGLYIRQKMVDIKDVYGNKIALLNERSIIRGK